MKKLIVMLVGALMLTGCGGGGEVVPTPVKEKQKVVKILQVEESDISDHYKVFGKVISSNEVTTGVNNGLVTAINYSVGDTVKAGDVLYTTDTDDSVTSISQQKENAYSNVNSSRISYNDATVKYEDQKKLYDNGIATKAALDGAKSTMDKAKITYNNALSSYNSIVENGSTTLENSASLSPIDGVISHIGVSVGEMSSTKDIVIATESVAVESLVSGKVSRQLSLGDSVSILFEDLSYKGTISKISPSGVNGTDSFMITTTLDGETILKPGYDVDVEYTIAQMSSQILVPKKAVLTDVEGDYVFLYESESVIKTYVDQGMTIDGHVQILNILSGGESIVVSGQNYIKDGEFVEVE